VQIKKKFKKVQKINFRKNNRNFNKNKQNKNYLNLSEKRDNYNSTSSDIFTSDYNSDSKNEIHYINKTSSTKETNQKHITCWILDSGASVNITNDINQLHNIRECHEKIHLTNGKFIIANYIGSFKGFIKNMEIIIENVYYSNEISKNLLSVCNLFQQNYKIIFNTIQNKPSAIIYNYNNKRIANLTSNNYNTFKLISKEKLNFDPSIINNNYELHLSTLKSSERYNLWHRRFAHFNIDTIKKKLLKTQINHPTCSICANSKLKNKPYKKSNFRASNAFELLHVDLVGPIPESIYGNRYFFTILDDYSRYGWVIFLKNKSDTFQSFYTWFNKIKNLFNIRI